MIRILLSKHRSLFDVNTWKAIAAMSENRVIGSAGKIPWHLPEDFKWFKETTMGHVLVMGRKTFESIGRPLPGRTTVVMTRQNWSHPGVEISHDFTEIQRQHPDRQIFLAGGADIYRQGLALCSELYLTVVKKEVDGDALLPDPTELFFQSAVLRETPELRIEHWHKK